MNKYKELTPELLDKIILEIEPPKFVLYPTPTLEQMKDTIAEREKQLKDSVLAATKEYFSELVFDEPTHVYHYRGVRLPSVSGVIGDYHKEFDSSYWSHKKAEIYGCPVEQVLYAWDYSRDYASNTGSYVHEELEKFACKFYLNRDIKSLTIDMRMVDLERANQLIEQGKKWLADVHKCGYELVATELMMVHKLKKFVGTADLIFWKDGKYVIADWKTNDKEDLNHKYYDRMYAPFNSLPDNAFGHYTLQLNLYALMLSQVHPVASMIIVHLKRTEVKSYKVAHLGSLLQ